MILSPVLRQRFFDSNGNPLAGGKLYSYVAGTTTPQDTYSNQGGTTNTNPVILDASGEADVWLDPTLAYKFVLKDSSDVTQWTKDSVTSAGLTGAPGWNSTSSYDEGSIVADSSGAGLLYVSLSDNNVGNALTNVTYWRMFDGSVRTITSSGAATVADNLIRSNSTAGNVTVTLPACATTAIGKEITVTDVGTGGNTTSVRGAGSDTIGTVVTYATALRAGESLRVKNMGTRWDPLPGVIPDGSIVGAKLAAGAVSATDKLADGIVTAAKMESSINLPGNAVQENGKNVVVSNTNATKSLAIVRGYVTSAGAITTGEGFSVNKSGTGTYDITFTTAFGDIPAVVASVDSGGFNRSANATNNATGSVRIFTFVPASTAVDNGFSFIAIGQRA